MLLLLAGPPSWATAALVAGLLARLAVAVGRRSRTRAAARAAAGAAAERGAVTLGTDSTGRLVVLSEHALSAHGLILGASGAGKSTTLLRILASRIHDGCPVVAIDLKGSPGFAAELRGAAAAAGRPFACWTPDGGASWNPLRSGNPTELKDKLIATEHFTEPHYQRAAERYVQAALRVLIALAPVRGEPTLQGVVEALDPQRLLALARGLPGPDGERIRDYVESLTPDGLSAVRGLASRLAVISESHVGAHLLPKPGAIDLQGALAGEQVVLFSLNASTYGGLAAQLGTLVVQDLVAAAGRRLTQGQTDPAIIGIDEFSALGSDNLLALLARGREAGVSVVLATQELADLDRAGHGLRDQVLGNTAVKIAHRQEVPRSAVAVAEMAGSERTWERSFQLRPIEPRTPRGRQGETLRLVDRYLVEPDQVRSLPTGQAVVIVRTPRSSTRLTRITPPGRDPGQLPPGVTR
jgi:conjugal transfer pilus assembly protein TraD